MANLTISNVEDIGNGQYRCRVTVPDATWGVVPGALDDYIVQPGDTFGLGPAVRALIMAGAIEGTVKPYEPPPEE